MGSGDRTFRFRPNLIFGTEQADEVVHVLDAVLSKGL
jgi:4-aminobutyrate aminotransferase-like enzyme